MFGLLKRLFSGSADSDAKPVDNTPNVEPIDYNGYLIFVMPKEESGQYRVAGLIEKPVVDDEAADNLKHQFIRSDVCMNKQQAEQITLQKCKLFIDQVGDSMFK
ncbi:HlyU family transcriptional regulator [Moritella sp. Urea-trap-13]|uniref:HlyU family transcriptional regulator n=1 Tax=Moritella sp. Urea-trap-13 TaxID=2058327 RepID=UPI000C347283|nr:HlyU family transcriptional regulator [Moritella sp. Urea-trap-13]PKH09507.1 hypothetical protein CXF93_01320 [Moritella sp. Urea-trap-13]